MNQDEAQKKYIELQLLSQQIKKGNQQLVNLEQRLAELLMLEEGLEDIKNITNREIFVSLGPGIFLETTLKDKEKVLVNVGSNTLIKKTIPNAKEIIINQTKETKNLMQNIEKELELELNQLQVLQKELQEYL